MKQLVVIVKASDGISSKTKKKKVPIQKIYF